MHYTEREYNYHHKPQCYQLFFHCSQKTLHVYGYSRTLFHSHSNHSHFIGLLIVRHKRSSQQQGLLLFAKFFKKTALPTQFFINQHHLTYNHYIFLDFYCFHYISYFCQSTKKYSFFFFLHYYYYYFIFSVLLLFFFFCIIIIIIQQL